MTAFVIIVKLKICDIDLSKSKAPVPLRDLHLIGPVVSKFGEDVKQLFSILDTYISNWFKS